MLKKWRDFRDTLDETTSAIRWFLGVFAVLAALGVGLHKWLSSLNTIGLVSFYVLVGCLILIGFTFIWDWRRKRRIESVPDLLGRIDQLTLDYIDEFVPAVVPQDISNELAELLDLDVHRLSQAVDKGDAIQVGEEYQKLLKQYERLLSPHRRTQDILQNLLLASALLNDNGVGLQQVTDKQRYHRLHNRAKALQKMLPRAAINMKVNEFWRWSEALYCVILTTKPIVLMPALAKKMVPPKARAASVIMRPAVEQITSALISGVRESIETYKERNTEGKDKDRKKS
jgi:hypothetical protein